LLEDQDRSLWDAGAIEDGVRHLEAAARRARPGPYQVQAAIAAVHAEARDPAATDWRQIVRLYDRLLELEPSPVFELNRAVAVAMSEGARAGLAIVERLRRRPALADYLYLHAARADLLRRTGQTSEARRAYARALTLAGNASERRFLERRLREL
jgi:RNA polymerase sigma-70 factor (ECF subfamily)